MAGLEAAVAHRARIVVLFGVLLLVALAALQLVANTHAAEAHRLHGDYAGGLAVTLGQYAIAAAEGAVLLAIAVALRYRFERLELAVVVAGTACVWALMLAWPYTASADPYAYVGYARLPALLDAYHPAPHQWTGDFAAVSIDWGNPIVPCVYGPLWLALNRLAAGGAATLAQGVAIERCLAAAAYAFVLVALRRLELPAWLIAIAALNPAAAAAFAQGGHNDAVPLALVMFAMVAAGRGRVALAATLVGAAALCKISFAALAPVALMDEPSWQKRIAGVAGTIVIAAVGSWIGGGRAYLSAMRSVGTTAHAGTAAHGQHYLVDVVHVTAAAVATAALVAALLPRARRWAPATWTFWSISATWMPWYVAWCLPYAVRSGVALAFLASWPLSSEIVAHSLPHVYPFELLVLFLVVAGALLVRRDGGVHGFIARLQDRHRSHQPAGA